MDAKYAGNTMTLPIADNPGDDRTPPQDFDAEQAVLGSILLEPEAAAIAFGIVNAGDFYRTYHQQIARAMQTVYSRKEPVDLVTVSAELRRLNQLDEVGGGEYLTALIGEVPTAAHVARYANIVAEKAALRQLARAGASIQERAYDNPEDVGAAILQADNMIAAIRKRMASPVTAAPRTLQEVLDTSNTTSWLWPGWIPNGHVTLPGGAERQREELLRTCRRRHRGYRGELARWHSR